MSLSPPPIRRNKQQILSYVILSNARLDQDSNIEHYVILRVIINSLQIVVLPSCRALGLRGVGDISGDELEISASVLVISLAPDVSRPPLALSVGGRGQVGVQPATHTGFKQSV